jgi:hypothetical protein
LDHGVIGAVSELDVRIQAAAVHRFASYSGLREKDYFSGCPITTLRFFGNSLSDISAM